MKGWKVYLLICLQHCTWLNVFIILKFKRNYVSRKIYCLKYRRFFAMCNEIANVLSCTWKLLNIRCLMKPLLAFLILQYTWIIKTPAILEISFSISRQFAILVLPTHISLFTKSSEKISCFTSADSTPADRKKIIFIFVQYGICMLFFSKAHTISHALLCSMYEYFRVRL